jgi:hypothetical protein
MNAINREPGPRIMRGRLIPPDVMRQTVDVYAQNFVITHTPETPRERGVIRQSLRDLGYSDYIIMQSLKHKYGGRTIKQNVRAAIQRAKDAPETDESTPKQPARRIPRTWAGTPQPQTEPAAERRQQGALFWAALQNGQKRQTDSAVPSIETPITPPDAADQSSGQVEVFVAPVQGKEGKKPVTKAAGKKARKAQTKKPYSLRSTTPKEERI